MECKNREINLQRHLTYSLQGDQIHTCMCETGRVRGWPAHVPEGLIFEKHRTGQSLKTEQGIICRVRAETWCKTF